MKALRIFSIMLVTVLVVSLPACTVVGPDYKLPAEAVINREEANARFVSMNESVYSGDTLPENWWQLYGDEKLNGIVRKALAANTDLRVAAANLARVKAVLNEARSASDPVFNLGAGAHYGRPSAISLGEMEAFPDAWLYDIGGGISYQLDFFGKIARAVEAAGADMEAQKAAYDLVRVTVAANTTKAYLDICSAGHEVAVARQSVDIQRAVVLTVTRLAKGGKGTALDVSRAKSQLEQLQAAVPGLEAQQRTALYRLAALMGEPPSALGSDIGQCKEIPQIKQIIPVGDGVSLLRRRPDIRQAERLLAAETARIGVATAGLYPSVSLGFSIGSTGLTSDFDSAPAFRWSIGPLISWTLPVTGPARSRVAQAEARTSAALARFDGVVLNALRETESSLTVYARELDTHAALKAARDQGALAAKQADKLYRYGRVDYLTKLDADRTLSGLESSLVASEARLVRNQVNLFLALGGGWDQQATGEKPPVSARQPAAGEVTP